MKINKSERGGEDDSGESKHWEWGRYLKCVKSPLVQSLQTTLYTRHNYV